MIEQLGLVGDRLAAQIEKSAEGLALYAACIQSGVIFLPLNTAYTPAEISYFVGDSGAKLLVADQNFTLGEIADEHGVVLEFLNGDGSGTFCDLARNASDQFETVGRGPDDLAAFLHFWYNWAVKGLNVTHNNFYQMLALLMNGNLS